MITIVALTEPGKALGQQLKLLLPDAELVYKPKPFAETVQRYFQQGHRLIMICAAGIAVRTLAPVLESKQTDPAVLVLDEVGRFVIPLVSGHEGGANEWGRAVAELISAQLVITTANPYLNPIYTVGLGCERHCPETELQALLTEALEQADVSIEQITGFHSIDIKADEVGMIALAETLSKPFATWDKSQLAIVEDQLSTKSEYVFKTVGVYGVAESAALVGAMEVTGNPAELVVNKIKNSKATCAIARSYTQSV